MAATLDAHYGALIQQAARDGEPVFMTGARSAGSKGCTTPGRNIVRTPCGIDDPIVTISAHGDLIP